MKTNGVAVPASEHQRFGAGLANTGATIQTASTETGFLANGGTTNLAGGVSAQGRMQVLSTGELQYTDGATTAQATPTSP